jgi:hypothetical protein
VIRSEWNCHVTLLKGGKKRREPMTNKVEETLRNHRHFIGPRVLYRDDGVSTSKQTLATWMTADQKRAGLKVTGNKHQLCHTSCSHLAMRGGDSYRHQGTGRSPGVGHHHEAYTPVAMPHWRGHQAPGPGARRGRAWRHSGDGAGGPRQRGGGRWLPGPEKTKSSEGFPSELLDLGTTRDFDPAGIRTRV